MNFRDAENLSIYLDGQLNPSEAARIETRLASDAGLRALLASLRVARGLLRQVPHRRAPRNFTLSPLDSRLRAPQPRAVPLLRYAGAVASLLFVFAIAVNSLAPLAARSLAAAPAPAYGIGGGVGGGAPEAEAPLESMAVPPSGTLVGGASPTGRDYAGPTAEALAKAAPPPQGPAPNVQRQSNAPVPAMWVLIFAAAGALSGGLSWYLDRRTRRDFRSKWLEK